MTNHKDPVREMEEKFAIITIEGEEHGGIFYGEDTGSLSDIGMRWCLVGRFLTESPIDF